MKSYRSIPMKISAKRWIKAGFWSSATIATGYTLMIYTTPNKEESLSPALKSIYDKNIEKRYSSEMIEYIKKNSCSGKSGMLNHNSHENPLARSKCNRE
ncbi:hypothetical protein T552_00397 [Pneumocystis carinii B80]|uniref:Cytochrome b mRNA-processing protein 4 n=1 Tax=Pneumocystis carinii (strain B80) TaxID=1408658 RepID=A0A0W4ZQN4_PNEC8|nr:hypothetical protein T552_00397 [Pneumocystis carinii B80]KTW30684.1 hypothetical protein T552_00397 [Pneumocystis carinii B80]